VGLWAIADLGYETKTLITPPMFFRYSYLLEPQDKEHILSFWRSNGLDEELRAPNLEVLNHWLHRFVEVRENLGKLYPSIFCDKSEDTLSFDGCVIPYFITPEPLFGWRGEATLVIDESDGEWIDIVHVRLYSKDLILKRTESKSFGCVYDYDMKWIFVPNAEQEFERLVSEMRKRAERIEAKELSCVRVSFYEM
jgi:hypothetical protein